MAILTEDYVSFETAKLLRKKGFDEPCRSYFIDNTDYIDNIYSADEVTDIQLGVCELLKPTHQMAMKWLREVHNIMVSPYALFLGHYDLFLGYYFEIFDLTNGDITGCKPLYKVGIVNKEDVLNTYEEACEAGIKYCLKNLI